MSQQRLEEGFLKEFCTLLDSTEVPSVFALWSAVSAIAGVLGRNCCIDMGLFKIYPNLYTVLVGPAASKKSTAIGVAQRLITQLEDPKNLLSQKMTPEALIQGLAETPTVVTGTTLTTRAEGMAIVSELSTLIDRNSFQNGMIALLTDLWDSPKSFEYRTRGRGKETLHNCCLNILSGSTMQWIKEAVPAVAIGGGFTSRVLFVYHGRSGKLVPFPEITEENKERERLLVRDLNSISRMSGNFKLSPQAKVFYVLDYNKFHSESELYDDKNLEGYAGRRHVMMLKLGMIVSASKRDTMVIHESDLQISLRLLESVEKTLPKVMQAITSEAIGETCEEVLLFIQKKKVIKKAQLIKKFMNKLSKKDLEVVLDTLIECQIIAVEGEFANPTIVYRKKK